MICLEDDSAEEEGLSCLPEDIILQAKGLVEINGFEFEMSNYRYKQILDNANEIYLDKRPCIKNRLNKAHKKDDDTTKKQIRNIFFSKNQENIKATDFFVKKKKSILI